MRYKLEDLCEIKYGKNQKKVEDPNGTVPIFGTGGLMGYANHYLYNKPSVLIPRKGSISKVAFSNTPFWTVDTLFYTIINEEIVLPKYLYYVLSRIDLNRYNEGTTIPSLRTETLNRIELDIPELGKQKQVVKVMDVLEEKINTNQEIINKMESLSHLLFNRWFMEFEFSNEEGKPYKSNGGEMVESELGMIPNNFKTIALEELIKKKTKKIKLKETDKEINYIGLEHMPRGSIALNEWETSEKVKGDKTVFDTGDILFGKLRPYFKKVGVAPISGVCSTDILVLNSNKPIHYYILVTILSSTNFINYSTSGATGTRMPRANLSHMGQYKICLPRDEKVIEKFNEIMSPIVTELGQLTLQNQKLTVLRDALLPKLLSGEIELPVEAESSLS